MRPESNPWPSCREPTIWTDEPPPTTKKSVPDEVPCSSYIACSTEIIQQLLKAAFHSNLRSNKKVTKEIAEKAKINFFHPFCAFLQQLIKPIILILIHLLTISTGEQQSKIK